MQTSYGILSARYCNLKLKLCVLRSNAGYYIGTYHQGEPISRESQEYYRERTAAETALLNQTFTQRINP